MANTETSKSKRTVRQNAKCKCGSKFSRLVVRYTETVRTADGRAKVLSRREWYTMPDGAPCTDHGIRCACGRSLWYRAVEGRYNAGVKCNAKCVSSTGFVCECSCGGKNHGAGHDSTHTHGASDDHASL